MLALQIDTKDESDIIALHHDVPRPIPAQGQVLVEVHAASVNYIDTLINSAMLKRNPSIRFPATMGGDFSGVIVEASAGLPDFKIGDEVFGSATILNGGSGSFAEFVAANVANMAKKPRAATHPEAGSLPLAGVSAAQALEENLHLVRGQKILIHGGAGGVGTFAIQIAKSIGAYVATTVRESHREFVFALGADQVVDYQNESFEELLENFDAVLVNVGGETAIKSFQVLRRGGILVSIAGPVDPELAKKYGVEAAVQRTDVSAQRLTHLAELLDQAKFKVYIDRAFSLEQSAEALQYKKQGHPHGKVVIQMR